MDSLSDRFKSLGVRFASQDHTKPEPDQVANRWPIEQVVQGSDHDTLYGSTFITIREFSQDYLHGGVSLYSNPGFQMLSEWGRVPNFSALPLTKIAFLDTETSGLAGGTGTYAFLIGLGFFTENSFKVIQFFMRDPSSETALLASLQEWLSQFRAFVTFNGKSFDIPLLKTRCLLNTIVIPFENMDHIDLLHLARRLWRNRLESRALGDLEKEIMGFFRDQDEVPGFLIPQYYFDYLRTGDSRLLAGVFKHNVLDIVSLAVLFNFVANLLENPQQSSIPSLDVAAIARLYEDLGRLEDAAVLYEMSISAGMPETFVTSTLERFAHLRRKQGQLDQAVMLWAKAVEHGHLESCVELAKHFEHSRKDFHTALVWIQKGQELLKTLRLPKYQVQIWVQEFEHRRQRVTAKAARLSTSSNAKCT
jgi:uncharacterized protein YprB with RNaseH-like and TPR domain